MRFMIGTMVLSLSCCGSYASGSGLSAADDSFRVYSYPGGPAAVTVLERCRTLRDDLHSRWLGHGAPEAWSPRCEIILHGTRSSYVQAIGQNGFRSFGSSMIKSGGERITLRRIDLLANSQQEFTALEHELTHVVIADKFASGRTPLWADEGIATSSDAAPKRLLHRRDCVRAFHQGTAISTADLFRMERFSSPHQLPAFYGQSLVLVEFLLDRDSPSTVVTFLETAERDGYEQALRELYDIQGCPHLDVLLREYALVGGRTETTFVAAAE